MTIKLQDKQWDEKKFQSEREKVLKGWPTGQDLNLQEAVDYQRQIPARKRMCNALIAAKKENQILVQPRGGVALPDKHIELLTYLVEKGEADILPTTLDSYTRLNQYEEAARGIEESKRKGRSMLNGYPIVNYGIAASRRIIEALPVPVQVRHGSPDARLLAEISLAGGFTDFEGGGLSYNLPYAKSVPPEDSIQYWQYVDRLAGEYMRRGVRINREPFGPLTGTLVPPAMSLSIGIVEGLLAAGQGVKHLCLGYGQNGNIVQDIAAIQILEELAAEYLHKYNFHDVHLTTAFHQWMGGFPRDEAKAFAVISLGAVTAALAGATKVIVKTPHEAWGIPTKKANAAGLKATRQIVNMVKDQKFEHTKRLAVEKKMLKMEVNEILHGVLEVGDGDWAAGAARAVRAGILDVPFSPSIYNAGKMLPAKDNMGAVRYMHFGNLPFSDLIKGFHNEKLAQRSEWEGREVGFQMVIDDVYAMGRGMLVGHQQKKKL